MAAKIIDGRVIAQKVNAETLSALDEVKMRGITPGLAVILVGDNPASRAYVRGKDRMCRELGLYSERVELPAETTQEQLLAHIDRLNADDSIHGILVQSPLPKHLDERAVINRVDPRKDVDGFHPVNVGKLLMGDPTALVPCTPLGCQRLLVESGVPIPGAHVVILGRSLLVGKPLASLLMLKGATADATVTVAHSKSRNLEEVTRSADILVAAIGQPEFVGRHHVKEGAVVLDVGINRLAEPSSERGFRFVGDVKFDDVADRAAAITPVPGGVGPMTIAMLMSNTVSACRRSHGL